jgi:hypothetical protein
MIGKYQGSLQRYHIVWVILQLRSLASDILWALTSDFELVGHQFSPTTCVDIPTLPFPLGLEQKMIGPPNGANAFGFSLASSPVS